MWFYIVAGHPSSRSAMKASSSSLCSTTLQDLLLQHQHPECQERKDREMGKGAILHGQRLDAPRPRPQKCHAGQELHQAHLGGNVCNLVAHGLHGSKYGHPEPDSRHPEIPHHLALHTADMMASSFMEDKDGNKDGFGWQELGAEDASGSAGQSADDPAMPGDSDEPVFMEAAPC